MFGGYKPYKVDPNLERGQLEAKLAHHMMKSYSHDITSWAMLGIGAVCTLFGAIGTRKQYRHQATAVKISDMLSKNP